MKGKIIVLAVIVMGLALLSGNAAIAQPTSLTVHVQDESGFPPPSEDGVRDIPDVPVALYTLEGGLVVQGTTNASGIVTFNNVSPGDYTLQYGGWIVPPHSAIGNPICTQPITVDEGENTITVNAPWIAWHDYDTGLPLEFNYMDLDPLMAGHQMEVVVEPGATVTATVSWWELPVINTPSWYVSLYGDWQPTAPLVNVKRGTAGPSSDTLHTETITFEAPTSPGVYKIRLVDVLDFTWPPSFYTAYHYHEWYWYARDMGVSIIGKNNYVDYGEGTITVAPALPPLQYCPLRGDIDCTCRVDIADIQYVASRWRCSAGEPCYEPRCDLNGDGIVRVDDIMVVASQWGKTCDITPLDFELVRSIVPTVRVNLPPEACVTGVTIVLDDVDPETPEQDITGLLFPDQKPPEMCSGTTQIGSETEEGEARNPGSCDDGVDNDGDNLADAADPGCLATVRFGENTITIRTPLAGDVYRAQMFNYTDDTIAVSPSGDPADIITNPDTGLQFHRTNILLDFVDLVEDTAISDFLRQNGLRAIGLISRDRVENKLVVADSSDNPGGLDPLALSEVLSSPILAGSMPDLVETLDDAVGEALPARLVNGAAPNAGEGYDANSGGFDNDGDSGPAAGCAAGAQCDELNLAWEHFFTDLFAAHRLRDHLVPGGTRVPLLAVIGTGFGNGGAISGTNSVLTDVPLARLGPRDPATGNKLTNAAGTVDFEGLDTAGRTFVVTPTVPFADADFRASGRDITALTDTDGANGHETPVTTRAAGNGSVILGPGKDVNVLPIRLDAQLASRDLIALRLAAHSTIDVINYSGGYPGLPAAQMANWRPRFRNYFDLLADKIFVDSSGNSRARSINNDLPGSLAPARTDNRAGADYPRYLLVSATNIADEVRGPEELWSNSTVGAQVSVSAPGGSRLVVRRRNGDIISTPGGTSWAAPVIAGLAAELIQVDEAVRGAPGPGAVADRRLQIVEIIEATSDDLGTTRTVPLFINDNPGNGEDDNFGWGRVNAWKAILAVVNRGIAEESHRPGSGSPATNFPSLTTITDADTLWYGFKIHSPVLSATVWIDGKQLTDAGSTAPGGIAAYAGVRSDQAILIGIDDDNDSVLPNDIRLDEDPTSGIVPVGNNGGEFIITFSITRTALVGHSGAYTRTLSLRRPGDDRDKPPFYNLRLELLKMREGWVPGVTFDDFVFEITPVDFGDAFDDEEDPNDYPSLLMTSNGACHLNTNLEWFGPPGVANVDAVSPEPDAMMETDSRAPYARVDPDGVTNFTTTSNGIVSIPQDRDRFDDGVTFFPLTYEPGEKGKVELWVCAADADSGRYADLPDRSLYVNAWIDWNTNDRWEEANHEHIIDGLRINPAPPDNWAVKGLRNPTTTVTRMVTISDCAKYRAEFTVGDVGKRLLWARFRLDYGEDVGRNDPRPLFQTDPSLDLTRGAARFGEVEDYLIGSDFGDARDPFRGVGRYPTLLEDEGAYHLDIYREWLGYTGLPITRTGSLHPLKAPSVSRERDACDRTTDQDGHPNLDPDNQEPFPDPDPNKPNCYDEDWDHLDDGLILPASFTPGVTATIEVRIHSTISARGYEYITGTYQTLSPQCELTDVHVTEPMTTPVRSRLKGRYNPFDSHKRLYLNVWADWNADGVWEDPGELIIHGPVDPPYFGKDNKYTLGEPFTDLNHDGVWEEGEPFEHVAGKNDYTLTCEVPVPENVKPYFYIRARLDYGENAVQDDVVVHHADADDRALNRPKGGALWGEVEDYTVKRLLYFVDSTFYLVEYPDGGESAEILVNVQHRYTGLPLYDLEMFFTDQDPVWTGVVPPPDLPYTWGWQYITEGADGAIIGLRLYTPADPYTEADPLGPGDSLPFDLGFSFEGPTGPYEIWIHATDIDHVNLGYIVSQYSYGAGIPNSPHIR